MRTGLQHFAFRDVVARIQSLEDVSPEARYSHGPGADRRFLSSLSCQTSVSAKQQLAADAEQSDSLSCRPSCWSRQRAAPVRARGALCVVASGTAWTPAGDGTGGTCRTPSGRKSRTAKLLFPYPRVLILLLSPG